MALIVADRVAETSTTTGTGALTLAAAITGFRRFSAVCSTSDTLYYAIIAVDANGNPSGDWETGLGTYSSANTLTRTTPQASTNANAAVNFAAGTKHVYLSSTAAHLALFSQATAASSSDVRTGTSTTKYDTPSALAGASAPQTLTDGSTITWDMSAGFNAKVTLGGNRTLAVSNPTAGWTYSLNVGQDGTGSRTMTWPSSFDWGTAGAPTLTTTASKWDRVTVFCTDAATPKFQAFLSGKGFAA